MINSSEMQDALTAGSKGALRDFRFFILALACGRDCDGPCAKEPAPEHLSLQKAESLALRHAPEIAEAYFNAQAAGQVVREVRAGLFPQVTGNLTAVATGNTIRAGFRRAGI